ncbi:hypothetical protein KRMM14A1004_45600 [Krasilnikovia sp. MM14-A1004]
MGTLGAGSADNRVADEVHLADEDVARPAFGRLGPGRRRAKEVDGATIGARPMRGSQTWAPESFDGVTVARASAPVGCDTLQVRGIGKLVPSVRHNATPTATAKIGIIG